MELTALNLVLWVVLLCAVWTDWRERRIPNALVVVGFLMAFFLRFRFGGDAVWQGLWGALVGGLLMLPGFLMRLLGAGDVKLMAVVGAFLGVAKLLPVFILVCLAGGLLAVVVRGAHGRWGTSSRLPYAGAIAAGVLAGSGF